MGRKALDLTGKQFSDWSVLHRTENIGAQAAYLCRCKCGVERSVRSSQLAKGHSTGCGCARANRLGDRVRKHGKSKHPLYGTWRSMRERCRSPNHFAYHRYGGRGIKVCERWNDFDAFLGDVEPTWRPGLTLDRIDNDGDYTPENVRWRTPKEQSANKAFNRRITFRGETLTLAQWAERLGMTGPSLAKRFKKGWPIERALTQPPRRWPSEKRGAR